jgi:hypothetical protein
MLIEPIVKLQKHNIKGLISFGKKRSERKRMKENRRKNISL